MGPHFHLSLLLSFELAEEINLFWIMAPFWKQLHVYGKNYVEKLFMCKNWTKLTTSKLEIAKARKKPQFLVSSCLPKTYDSCTQIFRPLSKVHLSLLANKMLAHWQVTLNILKARLSDIGSNCQSWIDSNGSFDNYFSKQYLVLNIDIQ